MAYATQQNDRATQDRLLQLDPHIQPYEDPHMLQHWDRLTAVEPSEPPQAALRNVDFGLPPLPTDLVYDDRLSFEGMQLLNVALAEIRFGLVEFPQPRARSTLDLQIIAGTTNRVRLDRILPPATPRSMYFRNNIYIYIFMLFGN